MTRVVLGGIFLVGVLLTASPPSSIHADGSMEESHSTISDSLAFEILRMIAREDTLGGLQIDYILGEFIESTDDRPTLKEIIGWCIENEENRFVGLGDARLRRRFRMAMFYGDPGDADVRRTLTESVERIYLAPPDRSLRIRLGHRSWDSEESKTEEEIKAEFETIQADLSRLPRFFRDLDAYNFSVLERRILSESILYKIAFEPRNDFDAVPEGWFLIDTANYQILHSEYKMTRNLPYPFILKAVERVSVHKREVDGFWFTERVQVDVTLQDLGIGIPRRIEMDIQIEDIRVNEGIADSVWAGR